MYLGRSGRNARNHYDTEMEEYLAVTEGLTLEETREQKKQAAAYRASIAGPSPPPDVVARGDELLLATWRLARGELPSFISGSSWRSGGPRSVVGAFSATSTTGQTGKRASHLGSASTCRASHELDRTLTAGESDR